MKTYQVIASQLVFYKKNIEAKDEKEAEEIAFELSGFDWKEVDFGEWQIEKVEEMK